MAKPIEVLLDITADPPVIVIPYELSFNNGKDAIQWTPSAASPQDFTFVSISQLPYPPFSQVCVSDKKITVTDDNQAAHDFPYTIVVSCKGTDYSTESTAIHTSARDPMGGGTNPTIRNN